VVEIVIAGGWLMLPIILCSILAIAIVIERFWTLSVNRVAPRYAVGQIWTWIKNNELDSAHLRELRLASPLGQILAAGLVTSKYGKAAMTVSIEQAASQVIHDLERYLSTLGTIAAITPLLGLLGTVIGMIQAFLDLSQGTEGVKQMQLSSGISTALITTAAGLIIAIPTMLAYAFFRTRTQRYIGEMEAASSHLVALLQTLTVRAPSASNGNNAPANGRAKDYTMPSGDA
jgi:biopolymer transport protein ExbB